MISDGGFQTNIGVNGSARATLDLIYQIERRQRYLHRISIVLVLWLLVFVPLALHYISCRPDRFSSVMADLVLERSLLPFQRFALAAVPTTIDDTVAYRLNNIIGGEDSDLHHFADSYLGLNHTGLILFYFAGLIAILFIDRSLKLTWVG